jgi:addiction module HigA family antidote
MTAPLHPGEILREEFMAPLDLKAYTLAKRLHVPRTRIERLIAEQTPVTSDTALRLSRFFGNTAQFWMNMQTAFDLSVEADRKRDEFEAIDRYVPANDAGPKPGVLNQA